MAAGATVLALVLVACGGGGDSGSSGDGRQKVTVAALPLTDAAALYIARDRGLFVKEGLDVTIQPVQQSIQALPALSKGQVDVIASANYVTFLQADEKGTLDLRILAEGVRTAPHMMDVLVPKDSPIKTAADLKGRTVAVNILNNIQSLTLDAILDQQGAGHPVYRQIAFPQMGPALEKGQVDAVHAVEPFDSAIQGELKTRVLLDGGSAPVRTLPISGYVTTSDFAEKHAKTAAAFKRAIEAASKIAAQDPSVVRAELPKYTKVTENQAKTINLPAYPATTDAAQLQPAHRTHAETRAVEETDRPGHAPRQVNRRQELTLGALGTLLAFGACEAVGRAGIVRRSYLPPASEVLARAVELAGDRDFLDQVAVTLRAWALGLALAAAIAIPLGLLLGSVPVVDDAVRAVIEFLRPLPSVALIPLVSLLLGTGTETEVTLITYASIWPILFNTVYGLGETDPLAKDTLRTFGFGRLSILWRVELPATAPFIAAGPAHLGRHGPRPRDGHRTPLRLRPGPRHLHRPGPTGHGRHAGRVGGGGVGGGAGAGDQRGAGVGGAKGVSLESGGPGNAGGRTRDVEAAAWRERCATRRARRRTARRLWRVGADRVRCGAPGWAGPRRDARTWCRTAGRRHRSSGGTRQRRGSRRRGADVSGART